jgi:O-antigen ligase
LRDVPDAVRHIRSWLGGPWSVTVAVLTVLAVAVALAPGWTTMVVCLVAVSGLLIWRYGPREGLWYLLVASIPFREPLTVELRGTVSLYLSDVLLFALLADVVARGRLRDIWRSSPVLKIGVAVLALSVPGLFTATRLFWGVASLYRIAGQIAIFVVAADVIRTGQVATRTLVAALGGLAPSVAYGLYQASLPVGAALPDWASQLFTWDLSGQKHLRVYSTFDQTLRFSHYLSIGFGVALGLAFSALRRAWKTICLVVGAAAAYCNLFTYSIGGAIGILAAIVSTLILSKRRALVLLPLLLLPLLVFSPQGLVAKADRMLSGEATAVAARLVTYRQGAMVLADHPVIGVGWGSIRSFLEHDYRVTRAWTVAFASENYFLQRGMALGVPGLALYVILCVLFFRHALRRPPPGASTWPRAALLIGGVVFYVQAQTYPAAHATSNYLLWTMFAIAENMARAFAPPSAMSAVPTVGKEGP